MHTDIGNKCTGVRINGLNLPFRTSPKNGDEIEVICDKNQLPTEAWLHHAKTGKARAAIRQALRESQQTAYAELGQNMLKSIFDSEDKDLSKPVLERALGALKYATLTQLYADVGRGELGAAEVLMAVFPQRRRRGKRAALAGAMRALIGAPGRRRRLDNVAVPVNGALYGTAVKMAENCFPLPGDDIVGIVTMGEGVVIYPRAAAILENYEGQRERWVSMHWDDEGNHQRDQLFSSRLQMTAVNRTGALSAITQTIADFDANILNLAITQRNDDFCDLKIDIEVRDVDHVSQLIAALKGSSVVSFVSRVLFE